jgi:hypothetical protein
VGAVIGSANGHCSIENRESAARRPIKLGIQVGICREQGLYDVAVESVELAMGASCGRGRIGRASEQTDLTDVVARPNKASRLLARKFSMLDDLKNSRKDDEERRFSSPLRNSTSPGSSDRGVRWAASSARCSASRASKMVMS